MPRRTQVASSGAAYLLPAIVAVREVKEALGGEWLDMLLTGLVLVVLWSLYLIVTPLMRALGRRLGRLVDRS